MIVLVRIIHAIISSSLSYSPDFETWNIRSICTLTRWVVVLVLTMFVLLWSLCRWTRVSLFILLRWKGNDTLCSCIAGHRLGGLDVHNTPYVVLCWIHRFACSISKILLGIGGLPLLEYLTLNVTSALNCFCGLSATISTVWYRRKIKVIGWYDSREEN